MNFYLKAILYLAIVHGYSPGPGPLLTLAAGTAGVNLNSISRED